MAWLTARGYRVAPFKVGPDFIDPGHHQRITRRHSRNLDGWMLTRDYNIASFRKHTADADFAVVEGVMGLFDGYDGKSEAGSTAQMAKWLGLPVLLVVNAKSMARSAAALVQGFAHFDPDLTFAGVVFNHVGSDRHLAYLQDALRGNTELSCWGGLCRNEALAIPERHLGLVTDQDHALPGDHIDTLTESIDTDLKVTDLILSLPEIETGETILDASHGQSEKVVKIGVARDQAFCFYYQDNLDLLSAAGAEVVTFSPMQDARLPKGISGLYFGGGYPELHAKQLAANESLRRQIHAASKKGMPIYGECGGFMYLCTSICDLDGQTFPMTGCFPFGTKMFRRLRSLGYREVSLARRTIIGNRGQTIRGHEFHYSDLIDHAGGIETVYHVTNRSSINEVPEGYQIDRTLGSYNHLHFGSHPQTAKSFVRACQRYQKETHP
jgi:cobyrinic acid a,c-diamide synthase